MSINFKFPFKRSASGVVGTNAKTIDAVVDDMRLLLLSNHGERPIHPDFGANLRILIFEPGPDVLQQAEDLILIAIEKWMPFVKVNDINVTDSSTDPNINPNELRVKINFEVGQIEGSLDQRIRN